MTVDLVDALRVRLIQRALELCGEPVTREAVARQFRRETARDPDPQLVERFAPEPLSFAGPQ